jgi:hypothetical protein
MAARGMTHVQLERLIIDNVTVEHLRDRVADGRVEEQFGVRRADFDTARIARLRLPDEDTAQRVHREIMTGEFGFYEAAERQTIASPASSASVATVRRRDLPAAVADATFAAEPSAVLGPFAVDGGHTVVRLLSVLPARLDDPTRAMIKELLFEGWLAARRAAAHIEWNWDRSAPTSIAKD